MTIALENVLYLSGATGATTKRTPAARAADIFNVKDFGAKGDGSTDDTAAIQAAVTAMYAGANKSCILYFPPGNYLITSTIDISNANGGSNSTSGIITGAGRWATYITGALSSGFIFSQTDGVNGPEEISNLSLVNTSTVIGTGALFLNNNNNGRISNCHFGGMVGVLMPFNIFQTTIDNCLIETNSHVTTGHTGTFGIAGYHCNVRGMHTTSAMQCGIQFFGANTAVVEGCGIENCTQAWIAGMATGWASACTVSGTVLTVGGNLGTSSFPQFVLGAEIFMQGITVVTDWGKAVFESTRCRITETHAENGSRTGTGGAGTYTISRSATVASPVPCISRVTSSISGTKFQAITSEACYHIGFIYGAASCTFEDCGGGATVTECVDAFQSTTGFTSVIGMNIGGNSSATFISCSSGNIVSKASWYFDPGGLTNDPGGGNSHLTFINCIGRKDTDNITGTSSSITNGSGGAGTVLNVVSLSQGVGVGIGMRVFVSGSQVATVTGNYATDGTLTGSGGTGTYRVDTSLNTTGTAITIKTGDDWIMPTAESAKTALEFVNCMAPNLPAGYTTGLNSLNRTFNSLPGQAGGNTNAPVYYGLEYDIVDSNTATWGATIAGGGANKVRARYNGTNWTVMGA